MKIGNAIIFTSYVRQNITTTFFATREGLLLSIDHIDVLKAIQKYYTHHEPHQINLRNLNDALEENFHHKGGMKYLYTLFPAGPVTQCCLIADLKPPPCSIDKGFGSAA